jgi:pimeloyl-ACP methyl ester carboxylesterase
MLAALRRPDLVPRLVIADSAPLAGPAGPLARYATALQELDLARLSSRQEADRAMATAIPDPRIRGFLLASLRPSADGSWSWLFNLDVLARDIDAATAWPDLDGQPPYPGPVLWLLGQHSGHVPPAAREQMRALFPRAVAVTVKAAGHWVHADQPAVVSQAIRQFAAG